MRLDSYLAEYFPEHSRSAWQKYIAAGQVLVNGEVVFSNKLTLGEDDIVTVRESSNNIENIPIPIIYEDDNILVLNKPIGILTHAKGGISKEFTIADFVKPHTHFENSATGRPGIVHRLDRDTSGVIITAKNESTTKLLLRQFAERKVKKTYYAIVKGTPKHIQAKIDLPIERNPKIQSQFRVGTSGKSAETEYKVISSHNNYHLVELKPLTGRTHQLRVHLAHIGIPIVGDRVYGTEKADRLFLHAASLEITIPQSQRRVFKAKLPEEFHTFLKKHSS